MPDPAKKRVLIVDDSAVMRTLLRSVLAPEPWLEVATTAADGQAALIAVSEFKPDLVLLDVEMPVMDGLATLRALRARGCAIPVIMCSSLTHRGARVTIEALADGASDYVTKPVNAADRNAAVTSLRADLIPRIRALIRSSPKPQAVAPPRRSANQTQPEIVVIGVSTGGPAALEHLLPKLPASFPVPLLVVQHMPELFTSLLAERLNGRCALRVTEATEGATVSAGNIVVARGNWHLEVVRAIREGEKPSLHLHQGPVENYCRPAVDVLLRSVATVYGASALTVILTGMGNDGLVGARRLSALGGVVIAQDAATSTVWGMPGAIVNAGIADCVLPIETIAAELLRRVAQSGTSDLGFDRWAVQVGR